MVQLNHYDIAGSFQRGQQLGTQNRLVREEEQRRNALADLAGQAYGAAPDQRQGIIQQAIATDPQAGLALDQGLSSADDRRNRTMVNMARLLTSAPEQARDGLYQRMRPTLSQFGMQGLPERYDPTVAQAAQSIVQAYSDNAADSTPSDIRSLQILRDNPELAELDRQRRQYSGMVPKMVETSQGIGWGTPGGGIQLAPLEGVAGQGQPPAAAEPPQLFAALGQKYGLRPTSVLRTPERNREVGGVTNSYHLTGQAADWVVPDQFKAQFMADARANGFEAIDEGDHIHIEPARGSARAGSGIAQPYQAPQRETIPAGYRARPDGSLEAIPGGPADPNVIANTSAARRPPSPAERRDASTRKTKYAQAQNVERGLDRIQQALQGLSGRFLDTGPIDQYAQRFTKAGQELEAAVGGMQNSLLALTRVPGIGAQSDLEARIAMLQYPSLDKAPEVNARTIENLRQFARDLKAAYDTAIAEDEEMMTAPVSAPREQGSDIDSLLDMYR